MKQSRNFIAKAAIAASVFFIALSPAQADDASCDPLEVEQTIELARLERVEIIRPERDNFRMEIEALPDLEQFESKYFGDNGAVLANGIEVIATGGSCTAIVEDLKVFRGEEDGWLTLRVAGRSLFLPRYFRGKFPVEKITLGIDLILFQKAYCDITVNAIIFKNTHPYLRPQPYPDPQC